MAISGAQIRAMRAITELTTGRKLRQRRVPKTITPDSEQRQYVLELVNLSKELARAFRRIVNEELPRIIAEADKLTRQDSLEDALDRTLGRLEAEAESIASEGRARAMANNRAARVNRFNRTQVSRQSKAVLGIEVGPDASAQAFIPVFVRENTKLIKSIPDNLIKNLDTVITRGARAGLRHEEIAKEIEGRFDVSRNKAAFIAADQIGSLNGKLTELRQISLGAKTYMWRTSNQDERVRGNPFGLYPNAVPSHFKRNGKIFRWDTPPEGGHPGIDFRCFPGSTEIDFTNGCHKLWRRLYSGPLVTIVTSEGGFLKATPNHPILTTNGWVAINLLKKGDHVFKRIGLKGDRVHEFNEHGFPMLFKDAFDLASTTEKPETAAGSTFDFHGDRPEEDVDVVHVERFLLGHGDATSAEHFRDLIFSISNVDTRRAVLDALSPGNLISPVVRSRRCADLGVSGCGKRLSFFARHFAESDEVRRAAASAMNAILFKDAGDNIPGNAEVASQSQATLTGSVQAYDLLLVKVIAAVMNIVPPVLPTVEPGPPGIKSLAQGGGVASEVQSDMLDWDPSEYQTLSVVEKTVSVFRGHVFNLQSNNGRYHANGIVAHNCRCTAELEAEALLTSLGL